MLQDRLTILMLGPYPLQQGKVVGGVQAVVATLAPALAASDRVVQLHVLSLHRESIRAFRDDVSNKLHAWHLQGQTRLTVLTRLLLDVWMLRRIVAGIQPDIVHGHGIGRQGYLATKISQNAVITVHGLVDKESHLAHSVSSRLRSPFVEAMAKHVLQHARVVISTSKYDANAIGGLVAGQHVHIPNPVAPAFFSHPVQPPPGLRVLFAGMLIPRKNIEGLLNGFALVRNRIPAARLVMIGPAPDPEYAHTIRQKVCDVGLNDAIDFLGHVTTDQLVQEMHRCRAVVLFSHEETLPTIIAQALALGKPVVASCVGGIADMVQDDETGFLVAPGDEHAFAERLGRLLTSDDLCLALGRRGQALARQRFDPATIALQTIDAYQLALQ